MKGFDFGGQVSKETGNNDMHPLGTRRRIWDVRIDRTSTHVSCSFSVHCVGELLIDEVGRRWEVAGGVQHVISQHYT